MKVNIMYIVQCDFICSVILGVNCSSQELPHIANPRSDISVSDEWDGNSTYYEIEIR